MDHLMELVDISPRLHMLRFPIGQAYLWRDGGELTLVDAGHRDAAPEIERAIRSLGLRACRVAFDRRADAVWCVRFQGAGMSS